MIAGLVTISAVMLWMLGCYLQRWRHEPCGANVLVYTTIVVSALLVTPLSRPLGEWLHQMTGLWNLEDLVSHLLAIVAAGTAFYVSLSHLGDEHIRRVKMQQIVVYPVTVAAPVLIALFLTSRAVHAGYIANLIGLDPDIELSFYWVLWCALILHIASAMMRALWVLKEHPVWRPYALGFLVIAVAGFITVTDELIAGLSPAWAAHPASGFIAWTGISVVVASAMISGMLDQQPALR